MTVGLPGAGVGGVFYLLSALSMPVHAAFHTMLVRAGLRSAQDRRTPPWSLVWRQFATAVAIIAGLWLTGWALAALLLAHPTALGQAETSAIGKKLPNVLKAGAVMVSVGTLAVVLVAVQIARLVVAAHDRRTSEVRSTVMKAAAGLLFMFLVPSLAAQDKREADRHLQRADSAFDAEDTATARREYEAALAANPDASKPLYRLGRLARNDLRTAESYFRRYTTAEPGDAWGWIALGDVLSRQNRHRDALEAYERAAAIAPSERDVLSGRARAERRRSFASPWVEIVSSGSRDTDTNQSFRVGGLASAQIGDYTRLSLSGGRKWLSGFSDVTVNEAMLGLGVRPGNAFRFEVSGGIARPHSTITVTDTIPASNTGTGTGNGNSSGRGNGRRNSGSNGTPPVGTIIQTQNESSENVFVGSARTVLRQTTGRSLLDLRVTRSLLDATPVLVINRVVRSEAAARADVEIFPRVKLRGGAKAGAYNATGDDNTRTSLLGGIAINATNAIEVSGVFQRLSFSDTTTSGYFAPKLAQLAEVGSYAEFESDNGTVLALDGGFGAQRIQEFGAAIGKWEPSYRLFASLDVPLRGASAIHLELDSYDSRLGSDAPSATSSWRSVSVSASLRLALH